MIRINLLPHHLRPIQRTPVPYILSVAVLAALNLADELSQSVGADARQRHARATSLRVLLDEVLDEERKTGS